MQSNDEFLYKCLRHLYDKQTPSEKEIGNTHASNDVGFNAYDAPYLSAMIKSLDTYGNLTNGQKSNTRTLLLKYSKQLLDMANSHEKDKAMNLLEEFAKSGLQNKSASI